MTIKELDACPSCGSQAMIRSKVIENNLDIHYQPLCSKQEKCGLMINKFFPFLDEAVAAWNKLS
jgi:hypothetical protein